MKDEDVCCVLPAQINKGCQHVFNLSDSYISLLTQKWDMIPTCVLRSALDIAERSDNCFLLQSKDAQHHVLLPNIPALHQKSVPRSAMVSAAALSQTSTTTTYVSFLWERIRSFLYPLK
jgi:hypothetical protein